MRRLKLREEQYLFNNTFDLYITDPNGHYIKLMEKKKKNKRINNKIKRRRS